MTRNVRGALFADYVRMIRGHKGVDWAKHLAPEDITYLTAKVDPDGWYPMVTFERLGNAILREIAQNNLDAVRMWGRFSVDALRSTFPSLVAEKDPVETLQRFRILRNAFFDFEALDLPMLHDGQAHVAIRYHMGATAEEAACHQTMGFFERLVELAGAQYVAAGFIERAWENQPATIVALSWSMAG